MEGEAPLDVVEGAVGAPGVHALVGLVDDEQVPAELAHPLQLVVVAAEEYRAFQPLQALEAYLSVEAVADAGNAEPFQELLPRHHVAPSAQGVVVAHEAEARLPADEALEVVVPRVGYRRPVGHDEHVERLVLLHSAYQLVGGERLAEAGLGVPEEAGVAAALAHVVERQLHGLLLLAAQHVGGADGRPGILPRGELVEEEERLRPADAEPLRALMALHALAALQEVVEVVVAEVLAAAVLEQRVVLPLQLVVYPRRVHLLADAPLHAVLRLADLRPALVHRVAGCLVGIDHRHHAPEAADEGLVVSHRCSFFVFLSLICLLSQRLLVILHTKHGSYDCNTDVCRTAQEYEHHCRR